MKKNLLLLTLIFIGFQSFAEFNIDASFKSIKNDKTYFFDFSQDVYLRVASDGIPEGTFDMSTFSSNWDSKSADITPNLVFQSPDGSKVYFMDTWGGTYLRHDWADASIDSAWPKPLDYFSDHWPINWTNGTYIPEAAYHYSGTILFYDFNEGKLIGYNWDSESWSTTSDISSVLEPTAGNSSIDYINTNLDNSSAIAYDFSSYNIIFYNNLSKSYIKYFFGAGKGWKGPFPLNNYDGWNKDWYTSFSGGCFSSSLQANNGHILTPIKVDIPEGVLNTDYLIKSVHLQVNTEDNSLIKVAVLPPNSSNSFNLFNLGVATGENLGSSCSKPVYFSDDSPNIISNGSAPYAKQSFKPQHQFSNYPQDQVNGQWYLDIQSTSTTSNDDYLGKIDINFEPKKEIQCGQTVSYNVSAGQGAWDMSSFCESVQEEQGKEAFWKFTPEYSKEYFLEIGGGNGYGDYFIKDAESGFNKDNWSCLAYVNADEISLGNLVAGKTYYLLVQAESTTGTGEDFYISCPSCAPIKNLELTGIGNDALDFEWTHSTSTTNYKWVLSKGATIIQDGTTSENIIDFIDLEKNTEYTFSVQTDCGDGLVSDPVSITVTTANNCVQPHNLSSDGIQNNDLDFTWDGPSDAIGYVWELKKNDEVIKNGTDPDGVSLNVYGLIPGTEYTFYVKTDCGNGNYSNFISESYTTSSICNPPTNITYQSSNTSLDFTWDELPGVNNFHWSFFDGSTEIKHGTASNGDIIKIEDLSPGKEYRFEIKSDCGNSLFSDVPSINATTGTTCETPQGLEVTNIKSDGFDITVSANDNPMIYQVVSSGSGFGNNIIDEKEVTGTSFTVTGLSQETAYDIYIQSICSDILLSAPASLLNISTLVGTENLISIKNLSIYPNPVDNDLSINILGLNTASIDISVYNLLGNQLIQKEVSLQKGQNVQQLDVSNLTSGTYFIKITENGKIASFKFVKL